jgi:tRNA_anti-like
MAMIKCAECKIDLSSEAKTCPHCGKPVKRSSIARKMGIGVLIFAGLAVIANAGKSNSGGTSAVAAPSSEATTTEPSAAPEPAPVEVSAADLFHEYDRNEVAADDLYKGKHLLVTGRVASITKDFLDNIVVEISTGQMFADIHATVRDSQKSVAARLSKRQQISVLCRGKGKILMSPVLDECLIQ